MENKLSRRLERIVNLYIDLIEKTVEENGGDCRNYQHITRNALTPMFALTETARDTTNLKKLKQIRHEFLIQLCEIKSYLELIEEFPEFREGEFKKGYFVDARLPPDKYISFAYEKLKGKSLEL